MVAVVHPPVTRNTTRVLEGFGETLSSVEFLCSWDAFRLSHYQPHNTLAKVWMVSHDPPSAPMTHRAALYGFAGWIWSNPLPLKGRVSPQLVYRLRFDATAMTTRDICELGEQMRKYGVALDPYWSASAPIDVRELSRYCDYPGGYLDRIVNAQPFHCTRPLVVDIVGGKVGGCPFRDVPLEPFTTLPQAMSHMGWCLPCPTGCYFHHPVEAANEKAPVLGGPSTVAEALRMAVLPRWTWWRISKLLPLPPRGIRGATLPDWEVMQRILYALVVPQHMVWDKVLRKAGSAGPNLEVTRYRWSHWVKVGVWDDVEKVLRQEWAYAAFADWTRVPSRRGTGRRGSLLWGWANAKRRKKEEGSCHE